MALSFLWDFTAGSKGCARAVANTLWEVSAFVRTVAVLVWAATASWALKNTFLPT